ncbi:MAG: hypothetical protein ACYST9_02855 [Planctomycetota bacterium]|jgi:hypothetical protein
MSNSVDYKILAKHYFQPAFVICIALLAIAASGMSIAIKSFGVYLEKEPLALKKPLDLLDESVLGTGLSALAPYKVVSKRKIKNEEIVKNLGTEDYIQWQLEDAELPPDSPVRNCSLFITYYGVPDKVPHVPEECYMGGGFQRLASESLILPYLAESDSPQTNEDQSLLKEVPVRYLIFSNAGAGRWGSDIKFSVLYFFSVNGQYVNNRADTRLILNKNLFGKYSYFSKVEWQFFNKKSGAVVYPNKDQAVKATQKLLEVILPILEKSHWPDMKQ